MRTPSSALPCLLALFTLSACNCSTLPPQGAPCTTTGECAADEVCEDGFCTPEQDARQDGGSAAGDGGRLRSLTALNVAPAQHELVCNLGQSSSVTLFASAVYDDGATEPVAASWTLDRYELATLDPRTGVLTASGLAPGRVTVTATHDGVSASATVDIVIVDERSEAGVPTAPGQLFQTAGTDTARTPEVIYPYDQVVMPADIKPPLIQWNGGAGNDVFRISLRARYTRLTVYVRGDRYAPGDEQ
ncbi:MAG: hypothetical protein ACK4N5_14010, partial [Myxococcales bacterium]